MSTSALLHRLRSEGERLPRAQQQVIEVLLQDPRQALSWSVDTLAAKAGVSMPTIGRMARSLGFEGVREFKIALAQDLPRAAPVHRSVTLDDEGPEIVQKVLSGAAASIQALQQQLQVPVLEAAARLLAQAERIDCYSVGATSAFMANDLQGRLFRVGRVAHAFHDAHLQLTSAASLGPRGVVVAISHVGRMPFMLEALGFARSRGSRIIAITQPDTPLAALADVVIGVRVPPDAVMRVGTEAYVAHLLVIELLMIMLIKELGPEATQHLAHFREVLQAHGQDVDQHPSLQWTWSQTERTQS
jgi:RpiR family carbohydrate utilization transcriptional regulator